MFSHTVRTEVDLMHLAMNHWQVAVTEIAAPPHSSLWLPGISREHG
jgi:hypothetical protein